MKNILLFFFFYIISFQIFSQNVGIGNPAPIEKLDVNGNVNITGTIKASGVAGQPNQVLSTNNSGNLAWADLCNYKNFESIFTNQTWIVPAGVTKVLVEAWGGGGGGNSGGGGGAGGYIKGYLIVTPSTAISIVVGTGGGAGVNGTNTIITYGASLLYAFGGQQGAGSGGGGGGTFNSGGSTVNFIGQEGENGKPTVFNSSNYTSTESREFFLYGDGGNAPFRNFTSGKGGSQTFRRPANTIVFQYNGGPGRIPGGGGGGFTSGSSYSGASGMVTIYY